MLFEQQILELHRRSLLPLGANTTTKIEIKDTKVELLKDGIDVEIIAGWAKVDELRMVANCAKHAEGSQCEKLRTRRPDLLTHPSRRGEGLSCPDPEPVVFNPLGGENLYVDKRDFDEYVASLKSFWSNLATAMPV